MSKPVENAKDKAQASWPGASIVERGKGHVKHQHPTDPNRFMFDVVVGGRGFHFGDEPFTEANEVDTAWVDADPILDAPWQKKMVLADYNAYAFRESTLGFDQGQLIEYRDPDSGETVSFQPQQLQWTNDLDQISPIAAPASVSAIVNDDLLTWFDAYGSGIDFRWQTQPTRLTKFVDIVNLAALGSPPQFIIDGGNPVVRISMIFQRSPGLEIWVDGTQWNERGNNPQTTLDNVEFRLVSTGEPVWWFKAPLAWDADQEEIAPAMRLRKQGPNLFVEILTPWSWLQSAAYPITIDVTVDVSVAAGADDCGVYNTNFTNTTHSYYLDSTTYNPYMGFARFLNVTVEGTIDVSYLTLSARGGSASGVTDIYGEDADNPGQVADKTDFDGRVLTTATVQWSPSAWVAQTEYNTSSINTIIQEIVDRGGWSSGNAMNIKTVDTQTAACSAHSKDSNTGGAEAPALHIEYTAAAGVNITVPVGSLTLAGLAPTVATPVNITVPVASLTLAGLAPSVATPVNITIPVGSLSLTGLAPTIQTPVDITIPVGSLTLTGLVPTVEALAGIVITVPLATLSFAGFAPVVTTTANVNIEIPLATLAFSGFAPTVTATADIDIEVPVATLSFSEFAPTIITTAGVDIEIPVGSLSLTGLAPSIGNPQEVTIPIAALSLAGLIPIITVSLPLVGLDFTLTQRSQDFTIVKRSQDFSLAQRSQDFDLETGE